MAALPPACVGHRADLAGAALNQGAVVSVGSPLSDLESPPSGPPVCTRHLWARGARRLAGPRAHTRGTPSSWAEAQGSLCRRAFARAVPAAWTALPHGLCVATLVLSSGSCQKHPRTQSSNGKQAHMLPTRGDGFHLTWKVGQCALRMPGSGQVPAFWPFTACLQTP